MNKLLEKIKKLVYRIEENVDLIDADDDLSLEAIDKIGRCCQDIEYEINTSDYIDA